MTCFLFSLSLATLQWESEAEGRPVCRGEGEGEATSTLVDRLVADPLLPPPSLRRSGNEIGGRGRGGGRAAYTE